MAIAETVDAGAKLGATDALRLTGAADVVTVAKGAKVVAFSMKDDAPSDETLLAHLLGPTGNLRAPTVVCGRALLVGFHEATYRATLL